MSFVLMGYESLDSTNDEARRRAEAGAEAGTVVWARRQDAGRGRRGRRWVSEDGNVYCSVLLRPACRPAIGAQLSLVAAVAVADAVTGGLPPAREVRLKWPNDVLVDGRKVAGILLESGADADGRVPWLVVGVGINVLHCPEGTDFPTTSLVAEGLRGEGEGVVKGVLNGFLEQFGRWHRIWRDGGLEPVRTAWLERAAGLGEAISVRLQGETVSGRFGGLDGDGTLLLLPVEGEDVRRIAAGDVFFPGMVDASAAVPSRHP